MKKIILGLILCAGLAQWPTESFAQADAPAGIPVGHVAPEIALPTLQGDTLRLSDLRGKYVVLDFWASWCGDCRRETPAMVELYKQYHPKGVEFLGVSFDHDAARLKECVEQFQIPWPQVSELKKWKDTSVNQAYSIKWIPSFYLIDKEGKVRFFGINASTLEEALKQLE